jgi:hypothetical protein
MEMELKQIVENILNRGGVSVKSLLTCPAVSREFEESGPIEEKISTFMEILEQEEKNERWASGITTYQISKIKQYEVLGNCYSVEKADFQNVLLKKMFWTCTVCFCRIEEGDIVRELRCGHRFHKRCIEGWLKRKASCPIDRSSMLCD